MAFDSTDTLYLINYTGNIYTINTSTGAATPVGTVSGLPNDVAHHGDFYPGTNLYYGISALGWSGSSSRSLLVINIGTLTLINTIPTVDNLFTLTFIPGLP